MTLFMGVRPKGETGLPMLDLHHLSCPCTITGIRHALDGGRLCSLLLLAISYVDYRAARMTLIR